MKADAPLLCSGNAQERPYSGEGLWHGMHVLMKTAGVRKADGQVPRMHDYRHKSGNRIIPATLEKRPYFLENREAVGTSLAE